MVVSTDMMSYEEVKRLNVLLDLLFSNNNLSPEEITELGRLSQKSCEKSGECLKVFLERKKEEFLRARDAEDRGNYEH